MRIGIVGGLDRSARELESRARAGGHELELHTGVVSGSAAAASLRSLVARVDLVVILTDINSHNGVRLARRQARLRNRPIKLMRRLSVSQLAAFLHGFPPTVSQSLLHAQPHLQRHPGAAVSSAASS